VQKKLIIMLFDFAAFRHRMSLFVSATFWHHIALLASTTFGHSSCGRSHLEILKVEEGKRRQWNKLKVEMKHCS
jgi:hypothetical protein